MADKNLKVALILSAVDKASAVLNNVFGKAERQAKTLQAAGRSVGAIGDKASIAGGIMTAFFGKTVSDARESIKANARLEQVFRSMGKTTNEAAAAAEDYASKLEFEIGVEDEQIQAVQAKFATFSRLITANAAKVDAFNRATRAAFDLEAAGFGDAASNAVQLGKALQNPALGAQALAKAGAINKEDLPMIKAIQASKGIVAAQDYVLKAVERQVKGVAAATADPTKRMQIEFTETSESIGKALLPELNKAATIIAGYVRRATAFIDSHKQLVLWVAKASVGLLAFGIAMKGVQFIIGSVNTALTVFKASIKIAQFLVQSSGSIAAAAVKGWEALKFGMFAINYAVQTAIIPAIKRAAIAFTEFGATLLANPITWYVAAAVALAAIVFIVIKNWSKISAFFNRLWQGVKQVFSATWTWLKNMFLNYTPYGMIIKYWTPITRFFSGIWDRVKNVFKSAWAWLKGLGKMFWDAGKNIVMSVWNGIKSLINKPIEAIKNMVTKIRRYLPFSPAKEGPLRDIHKIRLVETIAQGINAKPLVNAWQNVTGRLYEQMNAPMPVATGNHNSSMQVHFSPTINLYGSAKAEDYQKAGSAMRDEFRKLMREYEQGRGRASF